MNDQAGRLLALLSVSPREVLRLRLVVQLTVAETAAVLGSTPEAVSTARERALPVLCGELIAADRRRCR
ncbi:sigma factor-like helix-turn-helix DNA-binding protein [Actinocrispum sp. NPDC049592]|uniref:sigma factor-like helix-turn-helix DNA-binding protein n=1 Tax=Actinocrispum sp. NPDC049592 TaxID=3154835 RepID=UPI003442E543